MKERRTSFPRAWKTHNDFTQFDNLKALILVCRELQIDRFVECSGLDVVDVLEIDGSILSAPKQNSDRLSWVFPLVQRKESPIEVVIICGHYGCSYIDESIGASITCHHSGGVIKPTLNNVEHFICNEVNSLRQMIAAADLDNPPLVVGALYDKEYDWMAVFDDETQLFLPANVHPFRPVRELKAQ